MTSELAKVDRPGSLGGLEPSRAGAAVFMGFAEKIGEVARAVPRARERIWDQATALAECCLVQGFAVESMHVHSCESTAENIHMPCGRRVIFGRG